MFSSCTSVPELSVFWLVADFIKSSATLQLSSISSIWGWIVPLLGSLIVRAQPFTSTIAAHVSECFFLFLGSGGHDKMSSDRFSPQFPRDGWSRAFISCPGTDFSTTTNSQRRKAILFPILKMQRLCWLEFFQRMSLNDRNAYLLHVQFIFQGCDAGEVQSPGSLHCQCTYYLLDWAQPFHYEGMTCWCTLLRREAACCLHAE